MKKFFSAFILVLICASAWATPEMILSTVDHLFIPAGFDDNDNIELFVSGNFTDECYSQNRVETKIQGDQIQVQITSLEAKPQTPCEKRSIPFLEIVTLGNLPSGTYKVLVNHLLQESIEVKEARSLNADDNLYAQVDYVELGFTGGVGGEVMLIASAPDCLELDRVETISNGKDTVSILPKMRRISDTCSEEVTQFQIPVKFEPSVLTHNKVLLFVRTMDGKSIHSVIVK